MEADLGHSCHEVHSEQELLKGVIGHLQYGKGEFFFVYKYA